MKTENRSITIRVTLLEISECRGQFTSLTAFLQFKAQDAVEIMQETYGSGMAPTICMVDYQIIGFEDGNTVIINVEWES